MSSPRRLMPMLAVATFLAGMSCKPPVHNGSQAKTIDSFAANKKIRTNQCRVAEDVADAAGQFNAAKYGGQVRLKSRIVVDTSDAALKSELTNEALIALSAVPDFSQSLFEKMDGYIRITPDAAELCGQFLGDPKNPNYVDKSVRDTIESCSLLTDFPDGKGGKKRALSLVINAKADSIRHGMVRGFGYLHSQFYPRMRRNLGGGTNLYTLDGVDTAAMKDLKAKLAREFFADMLASEEKNGVFQIGSLSNLLGTSTDSRSLSQVMRANLVAGGELFSGLSLTYPGETKTLSASERATRSAAIQDFIAAEGYDSMFCRPAGAFSDADAKAAHKPEDLEKLTNTVKVFETFFNATFHNFSDAYVPALRAQATDIESTITNRSAGKTTVEPKAASSLALTGSNDIATFLAAILSAASSGLQQAPYAANLAQNSGRYASQQQMNNFQSQNQGQGVSSVNSDGMGCPCGCNGPPCNCQSLGCCGPNCSCCGQGGGGEINV